MYRVDDLYKNHKERLGLKLVAGKNGLNRRIKTPEAHRPGLSLSGYLKGHDTKSILILGKVELEYLSDLSADVRILRLEAILSASSSTPAVILAHRFKPLKELITLCDKLNVPLLQANLSTMSLLSKLTLLLAEDFSTSINCHGTLVELFGVGVMIQGDSSVGKSEAALGLIERGHRLITDDIVKVKKREAGYLEGSGAELTRHHMEIRGIGIINVANLYGAVCVSDHKRIDIIVKLEVWDDNNFYDRIGVDEKFCEILHIKVPFHILPVKPGRDVVLLLETIALNHRLKRMGYNSAKEFNLKLLEMITSKQNKRTKRCEVNS